MQYVNVTPIRILKLTTVYAAFLNTISITSLISENEFNDSELLN
ncbi:MAG: hypothetical protein AB7I49_16770 [Candidatus Nitrosocosmicus sp.]